MNQADEDAVSDEMHKVVKGTDFGWPYTYYDGVKKVRLVSPEYGGDGKTAAPAGQYDTPVATFQSARAVPLDMVFYTGKAFPASYAAARLMPAMARLRSSPTTRAMTCCSFPSTRMAWPDRRRNSPAAPGPIPLTGLAGTPNSARLARPWRRTARFTSRIHKLGRFGELLTRGIDMKKFWLLAASVLALNGPVAADEPDGIKLPQGFHATVVADHLGVLRHLAFRDADDLYVSTQWNNTGTSGDMIAIHLDKNHVADKTQHFGVMAGGTGIRIYKGALYQASLARIYRYSFHGKDLLPVGEPVVILDGMAATRSTARGLTFDDKGNMYVSSGVIAGVDWCADPSVPKGQPIKGLNPCPYLDGRAGIWRVSPANKLNQQFKDGEQIGATASATWRR